MIARSIPPSYIVVIRTAGERTFEACKALILRQVPEDRLHVVDERPFEASLRRCYQIGIESGAEWMVTVDADVLLREGAIHALVSEAEALPANYFEVSGMVLDKLTNRVRWASHRCYRVQYLREGESLLPSERAEIRPESSTLERMAARGFPHHLSTATYGIHDFDQFYADIYRKAFVHAEKHPFWVLEMLKHWKTRARGDADMRMALRGAADGLATLEPPRIDQRDFQVGAERALQELGLAEKPPMDVADLAGDQIEAVLRSDAFVVEAIPFPHGGTRTQRFAARYRQLGLWRFVPYVLGSALCDAGNAIKRLAKTS